MEIQGLTKTNTAAGQMATGGAANDDASTANAFVAMLEMVGANFGGVSSNAMDTKLMHAADAAAKSKDTEPREPGKIRDDQADDRAAAKPKAAKSRDDEDDSATDESDADAKDTKTTDDTGTPAQTAGEQAAAQVIDAIAVETILTTAEVIAPVIIAQQVVAAVDTTATQTAAVDAVQAAAVTDVVATDTGGALTDAPKAAVVEAPAAVEKAVDTNAPKFQQALNTAAAQQTAAGDTAKVEVAQTGEQTAAKTKDTAQTGQQTQRSVAAQEQSQALSQQLGENTKAKVQVVVHGPVAANQTAADANPYNIYTGYTGGQGSTANGQVGAQDATNALVQGSRTPAEQGQAQPAPLSAAPLAPQPQAQVPASQPGASSSAVRADIAAPAPAQSGNAGGQPSAGFGQSFANTQANAETTATQQANNPERPAATAQHVIDQIKVNITRAAKAGLDRVTIQLKPQDLGRVEVQLEMSEDHKVRVTVTADTKDTLQLLQNDSRMLERALNDAGLRTDTNNLHFNLRSESDQRTADGESNGRGGSAGDNDNDAGVEDETALNFDYASAARARGGVDTFA